MDCLIDIFGTSATLHSLPVLARDCNVKKNISIKIKDKQDRAEIKKTLGFSFYPVCPVFCILSSQDLSNGVKVLVL